MGDVFSAIADPSRRRILNMLANANELPLHEITDQFDMGRTAVSKHLAVLGKAGLVASRRAGRETRYRLIADPLREVQEWTAFYERFWQRRIDRLKDLLEEEQQ